jgi:hypothetical protein
MARVMSAAPIAERKLGEQAHTFYVGFSYPRLHLAHCDDDFGLGFAQRGEDFTVAPMLHLFCKIGHLVTPLVVGHDSRGGGTRLPLVGVLAPCHDGLRGRPPVSVEVKP